MLDQFWKLVKDADVWVNSYLHLDRKGISPQQLAAIKPGITCVELRGYGFKVQVGTALQRRSERRIETRLVGVRRGGRRKESEEMSVQGTNRPQERVGEMQTSLKRMAVNFGGSCIPGLSAVITGVVLAVRELGWKIVGLCDGDDGPLAHEGCAI